MAPGLLVFQFTLARDFATGWMFVLVYTCCACLRLARFNVSRDEAPVPGARPHFVGVPAPGGAMLALLPLFLTLQGAIDAREAPFLYGLWMALVGWLMISRVPTISSKALRVPRERSGLVLVGAAVVVGLMVTRFWLLLVILDLDLRGLHRPCPGAPRARAGGAEAAPGGRRSRPWRLTRAPAPLRPPSPWSAPPS